eukprot:Blabericola_migrator_1__6990@NODE_3542_length_1691_cov_149_264778_g2198_i0_p1_GENE_NODE_3542_length_1691_cov_149_264778_g2198_i0NODE_3542_length_1691_cov_149_264778_g2198_i0_p1_ORF_typecomplete_len285_score24_90_NODE_3542_length_1691_cov_149_264778_g2198_i05541408
MSHGVPIPLATNSTRVRTQRRASEIHNNMLRSPLALILVIAGSVNALRRPRLNITDISCTPNQSAACLSQCARNNCPAVRNEGTLNSCLAQLDPTCSVTFKGLLEVTLENHIDFCNYPPTGYKPGGWLFNVPWMGEWDSIVNPWLILPQPHGDGKERCEYLMREIYAMADPMPATISHRHCIDTTSPVMEKYQAVPRDYNFNPDEDWAYGISVLEWMNSFFIVPEYQQCYEEFKTMKFAVEVESTMNGGFELWLPGIVQSGTIPGTEFQPSRQTRLFWMTPNSS